MHRLRAKSTICKTAKILSAKKEAYVKNAEELKSEARASYQANPNGKKAASHASSKRSYSINPERKKSASRASSKRSYSIDPERKKSAFSRASSKRSYSIDPERKLPLVLALKGAIALTRKESCRYIIVSYKKKAAARARYAKSRKGKLSSSKAYYANHKDSLCGNRRSRYILAEPKPDVQCKACTGKKCSA